MDLQLLGPVEAAIDGRRIALGATKQRAVLAMLGLHVGRTVPTDRLVEGLWGEDAPASAPKMVQHYVWQLRRLLEDADATILTHGRGYELTVGAGSVDASEFERRVGQAAAGRDGARRALELWRGPPLADVADEPFAAAEVRRLEELRLRCAELAVDADLAAGLHRDLLPELDTLVAEHPLSERLHAQYVLALYRSGRQADALDAYARARRVLVDEVGIEPGPELQSLQRAVLDQDPGLDLPRDDRPDPPPPPRPPARSAPAAPPPRRRVVVPAVCAALVVLVAVGVLALSRGGDDGLEGIDENAVGRIDPESGTIDAQYAVGRGPGAVVAGGGSVWAASDRDRTVTRIDPRQARVATIDPGGDPAGLAFGGGSLWIADGGAPRVIQVDPRMDRVVHAIGLDSVPRAVTAGYGAIWVAGAADGAITRIDLRSGRAGRPRPLGVRPTALAAGAGALWLASESAGTVSRIEPRTGAILRSTPVGGGPAAIAVGAGGVWVANRADGTVSRLDGASGALTDTVRVGRSPVAIAAAGDDVWASNAGDGTLSRIDARTLRVVATVETGGSPSGLAVTEGAVWSAAGVRAEAHRGGTLQVAAVGGSEGLAMDPGDPSGYEINSWRLMSTVYDGLVAYRRVAGAAGGELVPDLAESLPRPSDNGRTYVFTLRRGLRYSDGTPVRPGDVRASIERFLRGTGPELPLHLENVVGTRACVARPARCDLSAGIQSDPRARTVTIRLTQPDGELLHKLAHPFAYVMPAAAAPPGARRLPPPGTGPYRVAQVGPTSVRLVRNRRFRSWSRDARPPGFPSEIRYSARARPDADVATGDLAPGPEELQALATRYGGRLRVEPNPMTEYLVLNTRTRPFADLRVRRALNLAIDRDRIVTLRGGAEVSGATCRLTPPGLPGHRPDCAFPHDPAGARRLVRSSGTRGERVTLWTFDEFAAITRYVASVLRDLGYRPAVREFADVGGYFERLAERPAERPDAAPLAWFADFLSPSNFIDPSFTCGSDPLNYAGLCDRRLDALVDQAVQSRDLPEAAQRWDLVERRFAALAPAVPLANSHAFDLLSERAGNFQRHPLWGALLDQVWVR